LTDVTYITEELTHVSQYIFLKAKYIRINIHYWRCC